MTNKQPFSLLQGQQFMNLITFRKTGQSVITPVWFAEDGDQLYVMTGAEAGKVKRIRNNGRAEVGPSDRAGKPLGPTVPAAAQVLTDAASRERANALLNKKYGIMKRAFDLMGMLRGGNANRAFLVIKPAATEQPDAFGEGQSSGGSW